MYVSLERIVTRDGVRLDGAFVENRGRKRVGILFVHGLTSNFLGIQKLWRAVAQAGTRRGIAVAAFNTRGHDLVAGFNKKVRGKKRGQYRMYGAAFERFKDCILDIRAGVKFLRRRGYPTIVLLGHSTGANKALYYVAMTKDRRVKGLVLAGGLSDVAIRKRELGKNFAKNIAAAERFMKRSGKQALLPPSITKGIWSAQRYVSLYSPGSPEDVFPYHNSQARWAVLRRVKTPTLVVLGKKDEFLDRPATKVLGAFLANAPRRAELQGRVVAGAGHDFRGKEKEFASVIMKWIRLELRA